MKRMEKCGSPLVAITLTLFMLAGALGSTQAAKPPTEETPHGTDLGVTGTGRVLASPDTAFVTLGGLNLAKPEISAK